MNNDEQNTSSVNLTQGYSAIVSPEDYERVARYKWCIGRSGRAVYAKRGSYVEGVHQTIRMHRFIMNAPLNTEVDHINGDTLDNRRENLRLCCREENLHNQGKRRQNKSGYKGVVKGRTGWTASLARKFIGTYDDVTEAARAYDTAARKTYKDFARLNFPDDFIEVKPRAGGPPRTNTSGFKGVSYHKETRKWTARILHHGKRILLGYFTDAQSAADALEEKKRELQSG